MTNVIELPSVGLRDLSYHDLISSGLTDEEILEAISELSEEDAAAIFYDWHFWARASQRVPNWDWRVWVLKGGRGSGKFLGLKTIVPTVNGNKTMETIEIGDKIFDENGIICNVIELHPVNFGKKCYKIKFSTGEEVITSDDHLWSTEQHKYITTQQIKDRFSLENHSIAAVRKLNVSSRILISDKLDSHYITSVDPIDSVPVRCIKVDSPNHLFCITRSFIPTHNTWAGANWFNEQAHRYPRLALVGRTASDVRDVMVLGESGLIATSHPDFRPVYEPGKRRVTWPNGAEALCFSADEPNVLRGPQFFKAWADEVAAWRKIKETWDNLMFGLRLGDSPQCVVTTTPRPIKEFKDILERKTTEVTTESTLNNVNNLAPQWASEVITIYQGTRLGQQELEGKVLDDNPNALWTQAVIDEYRVYKAPEDLDRVVVGVDPPSADNDRKDVDRITADCGIIVAGRKGQKNSAKSQCYVLDDLTLVMPQPTEWAKQVVTAYHKHKADAVIAEANNGGAMVKSTIQAVDPNVPVEIVYASRGKAIRAEPVSTLYESGRVHHFGQFPELEDQLTGWEPGMKSPDRLDADVWAISDLMVGETDKPVRMLVAAGGRKPDLNNQFPLTPNRPSGYGMLNDR